MSKFECWHDRMNAGFRVEGRISDKDLMFSPREAVEAAKRAIIAAIVDRMMEKLSPHLDEALHQMFVSFNKENKSDE